MAMSRQFDFIIYSATLLMVLLCLCGVMVSAKSVETSARVKRTTVKNCDNVKQFFQFRNITMLPPGKSKGSVCGGECCGDEAEEILRKQGQKDFATLLRHNSRSTQGLLSFTAATLQNHVHDLSRQSENKTLQLFSQVYKGMAVLSKDPISRLYSDFRNYILVNTSEADFTESSIDIKSSVSQFFIDFFPLVYHHILLQNKAVLDFAPDYKACLKKTTETIMPFGEIPKEISTSVSKGLETTRLLLQAFQIGTEVLNTTDRLMVDENSKNNGACHNALLKMTYCPKCQGLDKYTKPCSGYCLNVLRGCLTKYVAELDSPWNGYVEAIESLVDAMKRNHDDVSVDFVMKNLDTRISEAIMRAMERGQEIDIKVKRSCGPATFSNRDESLIAESSSPLPATSKPRSANPRIFSPLPESQLEHFLDSIDKTRGFYANLADTLCKDDSFVEPKDQRCWNGERIAEYTKTVVVLGRDMQKYNPEVKPMTNLENIDPRVADLVDKLRHVHHVAMSSVGTSGIDVDYMQRDGVEGSGSGAGPENDDAEEDSETTRGSGSGTGPVVEEHDSTTNPVYPNPTTGEASLIKESLLLIVSGVILIARLY